MAQLLITGGAGFIGSHTCLALLDAGHHLVVLDNFSNSSAEALRRVAELAGLEDNSRLRFLKGDIRNNKDLENVFSLASNSIDAVIHFAGLKAVEESIENPLCYWDVNLHGTRSLLNAMQRHSCYSIVFSSSATLYGYPKHVPIKEDSKINPINPYGNTKASVECLLSDLSKSEKVWRIACLRYFNPVGAHPSGRIGEDPNGVPNNLFPYVSQVAIGLQPKLEIYGSDWPTDDGTAVRDYIHVMDLAEGHCAALDLLQNNEPQFITINLGSGKGYSVLQVINCFEKVIGRKLSYKFAKRRQGDVAFSVADPSFAALKMGWRTTRDLTDMCRDSWNWQLSNPSGYKL